MRRLRILLILLLVCAAVICARISLKPVVYSAQKTRQMRVDSEQFYEIAEEVQAEAEAEHISIPYEELYLDMLEYNRQLCLSHQIGLNGRKAYQASNFDLTEYGLPTQVFGVIRIPKMDLEMPLYLGASDDNMANGAAVLAQTSIPVGGESSNAVIAGHRSWNGYKYFLDIELLEVGDEIYITNIWDTLTYKVSEIRIINPDDIDSILIQKDRDMITLLTCHPYGSGGLYRYLVFCDRAEKAESVQEQIP